MNYLKNEMLPEIWEPELTVVFVGTAVTEPSDTLGFYHLHPRDRFWELLEVNSITPTRIISKQERKAMADGQANGSVSDPVRSMFIQKRTSQLLRLGIGLTDLNRRVVAFNDKDKAARPTPEASYPIPAGGTTFSRTLFPLGTPSPSSANPGTPSPSSAHPGDDAGEDPRAPSEALPAMSLDKTAPRVL